MHRRLLFLGAAAALALPLRSHAQTAIAARRIKIRHAATNASFDGVWHNGIAPDPIAMADLSAALADSTSIRPRPFDPAVIDIVWQVANRARLGPELVIRSGYRTPAINRAVHGAGDSQHLRAGALDLEVPAGRMPAVVETALKLEAGGVGVYGSRAFVHLDSGPVRRWSDGASGGSPRGGRRIQLTTNDPIARIAEAWGTTGGR
jgi:uncharacterized protein YcbK (DUF882 family)